VQVNTKSIITFLIAAGLVFTIWLLTHHTTNPAEIANTYLHPYPNLVAPLQQKNTGDVTNYTEAFRMYELGYHSKAEDFFMSLDPNDEAVQFYRSLNALFAHDSKLARKGFDYTLKHKEHRYYIPALWYAALNYLFIGEKRQATILLVKLADGNSEFAAKANELLSDLN